jgi:hypothetical protein
VFFIFVRLQRDQIVQIFASSYCLRWKVFRKLLNYPLIGGYVSTIKFMHLFRQKTVFGYTFGRFFTNLYGHSVRVACAVAGK